MSIEDCEKCGRPQADVPHFCGRFVYVGRLRDLATASAFREVPPASPLAALKGAAERMEREADTCLACLSGPAPGHTICLPCEREWDMAAETSLAFVARKRGVSVEAARLLADRKRRAGRNVR